MNVNDPKLIAELRRDEGVKYSPYLDSLGIETVGVGHNLKAHPLTGQKYPLTNLEVDNILKEDLIDVIEALDRHLPWWENLTEARQRVLVNMAFNMGIAGLLTFRNTLNLIETGHYARAAENMLNSKWAKQVHDRANRLAEMMRHG